MNLSGFFAVINQVRTQILEAWKPGLGGLSYWQIIIAFAIVTIIVVALINRVRLGSIDVYRRGISFREKPKQEKGGSKK